MQALSEEINNSIGERSGKIISRIQHVIQVIAQILDKEKKD